MWAMDRAIRITMHTAVSLSDDCQSGSWVNGFSDSATKGLIGNTQLPSGVIIQWGEVDISAYSTAYPWLSKPCRNAGMQVTASLHANGTGNPIYAVKAAFHSKNQLIIQNTNGYSAKVRYNAICH